MTHTSKIQNPSTAALVNATELVASNEDLLTEILLRLPVKPLFNFKLVSKHWLSLISSRRFCLLRNPPPNPSRGLFLGFVNASFFRPPDVRVEQKYIPLCPNIPISNSPSLNFDFTVSPSNTVILHSCNGLMLCCSSKTWDGLGDVWSIIERRDHELYVYNPTTKCFVVLPHSACKSIQGVTLVFDPFKSPHYKVVLVDDLGPGLNNALAGCTRIQVQIYSSETGIWTNSTELGEPRVSCANFRYAGVYWNGSIHWRNRIIYAEKPGSFLRYHVDSQVFHEMPSPPVLQNAYWSGFYFAESCDHLHFIEPLHVMDISRPQLNVYEMKEDYSEWFLKYQIDLLLPLASYPEVIRNAMDRQNNYVGHVLSLIRGDKDESPVFILRIPGKVLKYNLIEGTLEKLVDISVDQEYITCGMLEYHGEHEIKYGFPREHGSDYIESICSV